MICDEAHRTTGVTLADEDESSFVRIHDNSYIRAAKRLYMTATPKLFNDEIKNAAKEKDAVLASMDDQSIYGPVFHRLGFGQAVALGLLTDYKVVVLAVPEDDVSSLHQRVSAEDGELSLPDVAKLVGCWNALAKRKGQQLNSEYGSDLSPMRRAVMFCKDIKTSNWVASQFSDVVAKLVETSETAGSDLVVQCRHVDGAMNAVVRGEQLDWLKDETPTTEEAAGSAAPICRVLTNARCLSEGVDVPSLDAVCFLNPRKSQVDVIQAVGRVMRRASGKEFGYIVLPVAIPAGTTPERALDDNKRFKVIWQVLQAIRAHDDRFEATINSIEYNANSPENIVVDLVRLDAKKPATVGRIGSDTSDNAGGDVGDSVAALVTGSSDTSAASSASVSGEVCADVFVQPAFNFSPDQWRDAIYSRIVKKVGSRLYWDDWSEDIASIAARYISLIDSLLDIQSHKEHFETFVTELRETLNPSIDRAQAVEMLAQHLITKPLFDAMFDDQQFTAQNPVSQAMQAILDLLAQNKVFELERRPLDDFYQTMVGKIRQIDNLAGKQQIMVTLFDRFFAKAFPRLADRLGIVFTPVEVVDYLIHSANQVLFDCFGKTFSNPGVAVIEPFVGTGTFVARLLQSGLISADQLEYKYRNEIFANEIVLLSYYIASINIENVYRQIRLDQGFDDGYVNFPGISLVDTFQLNEKDNDDVIVGTNPGFEANLARAARQQEADIRVVLMNPPYSVGQASANDDNQNLRYPVVDAAIERSYVARSTGTNKNSLYDSYFRALRWASNRIKEHGVIAFVSNSSFIDGNTADGVRLSLMEEFSHIYLYNMKGNARSSGELRRQEAGNVFGEGSRTGVALTVLVKQPGHVGPAQIHYAEVPDYASRREKLDILAAEESIAGTSFELITPNQAGDWINQRDERFLEYQPIGDKKTKGSPDTPAIFQNYSAGLKTNRDVWCYNFSQRQVAQNISRMIANYNAQVEAGKTKQNADTNPANISWNRQLFRDLDRKLIHRFEPESIVPAIYRPFCKQAVYFNRSMNDMVYQLPQLFPTPAHRNVAFGAIGQGALKEFSLLMTVTMPDLEMVSKAQWCSLFTWEKQDFSTVAQPDLFSSSEPGTQVDTGQPDFAPLDFSRPIADQIPESVAGYTRRWNITDDTLVAYRNHYGDSSISKEDVFFYLYALLHHPSYRAAYQADLKKMLPRIPKCAGFFDYSNIGRQLAGLHANYELVEPYPLSEQWVAGAPHDPWERYRVHKPAWVRKGEYDALKYNPYLTLSGIPALVQDYQVGGRSPLEWVIDRYKVVMDKTSRIVNDPNEYCREIGNPSYIVDLVKRLVNLAIQTQNLVSQLPEFQITD